LEKTPYTVSVEFPAKRAAAEGKTDYETPEED
jgi:hypothetical protein